jgi:UDP-N-acetylmuramate dehydrogenase
MKLETDYPLKKLNTFAMDVRARYFARPDSAETFRELLLSPQFRQMDTVILGGGSNVLFTRDINGLVLKNDIQGITKIREDEDHVWIRAGAGESWHGLVRHCIGLNLAGIENLSLIPGNTGAAPIQNIGAYGVELRDVFHELEAMDQQDGSLIRFTPDDCSFGYRQSIFKQQLKDRFIICSVTLKLNRRPEFNISYGTLAKELERMGVTSLSIDAVSQAVIRIRTAKLPDPAVVGNAGSFFKNPELPEAKVQELKKVFPEMITYAASEGKIKIAAGWLIEQCGWKGYRKGDAGVHPLQALVLVNYGHATGTEILEISRQIMASVSQKFGILLEREVNVL